MNWNIQEKLLISFSGIENMNFQADPTQKDTTNDTVTLVEQSSSSEA